MAKGNRPLKLSDVEKAKLSEGDNPFVEHAEVLEDDQHDLGPGVTYHVSQFEQTQVPRGNWILTLGIGSLIVVIGSLVLRATAWPFLGIFPWPEGWTYFQTLLVIVLVLPTALWGTYELRAIRFGVTPPTQVGTARTGTYFAWGAFVAYVVEMVTRWSLYLVAGIYF